MKHEHARHASEQHPTPSLEAIVHDGASVAILHGSIHEGGEAVHEDEIGMRAFTLDGPLLNGLNAAHPQLESVNYIAPWRYDGIMTGDTLVVTFSDGVVRREYTIEQSETDATQYSAAAYYSAHDEVNLTEPPMPSAMSAEIDYVMGDQSQVVDHDVVDALRHVLEYDDTPSPAEILEVMQVVGDLKQLYPQP